jgi:hypothetical protein
MMRPIVFLLLGPISVAVATYWIESGPSGSHPEIVFLLAMFAFFLTLPITALVGTVDECLALYMSILPRAPLTAAAGAIVVGGGLTLLLSDYVPPPSVEFWTFAGAAYAGTCSLLANDWTVARRTGETDGLTSGL